MTRERELSLEDLLAVEDDPCLLDYRCPETGILLWPAIRCVFFRFLMEDLLYGAPLVETQNKPPLTKALWTSMKGWGHNRAFRGRGDVLLVASGSGVRQDDGRWFNRLADPFALLFPDRSVLVEDFFDWNWPGARCNQRVLYRFPFLVKALVRERFGGGSARRALARDLVALVRVRAEDLLHWRLDEDRTVFLERMLVRKLAGMSSRQTIYRELLKKLSVRLVLREEGCYGHSAPLFSAARSLGIATAEYQHGVVSKGHYAYMFAASLLKNVEFRWNLPEHFLGYGKWWNEQFNAPLLKHVVGNPYREFALEDRGKSVPDSSRVLVLGDGIETERYLALCRELARVLGASGQVWFRPHPLERSRVRESFPSGRSGDVFLDDHRDIYGALLAASAVVSEVSTGLFDAVGLANKILVWDTPKARFAYPELPFESFTDVNELAEKIRDPNAGRVSLESVDEIWAPNWQENYSSFLEQVGCL
ncbi:hypothetical protein [Aminomonas paucivorans]|uniref:hypothetical protein n=1 Tax=Aminomonas paucivorans TaxID=81412 RepID=UPI0012E9CF78|nr:hypothetical protein [Aminomonas paucivorans]